MRVTFEQQYLDELFHTGKCSDKKHRYQPDIVSRYAKCVLSLQKADDIEDIRRIGGLHYEMLKGDKAGISSIRVNDQYRVEFTVSEVAGEDVVSVRNILELSNHYKKR